MRRVLLILLLVILALPVSAADYVAFEQITVTNTAVGIASATIRFPSGYDAVACEGRLETAQIRYRWDGVAATSSVGTVLEVGDVLSIGSPADARRLSMIRTGGTSGVLDVHCWR